MADDYLSEELFPTYPLFDIIPGSGITILVSWQNLNFLFFCKAWHPMIPIECHTFYQQKRTGTDKRE